MGESILNVNGVQKKSSDLTYEDLTWLYWNYIKTHGHIPTTNEGKAKYNLPQQRIIKKITSQDGHTFNEFINQFGKVKHVRTEDKSKYDEYLNKYIKISKEVGHGLTTYELMNNNYGLPSAQWFVNNCPDKSVESFDDFVQWTGFRSNKTTKNKEEVINALIKLEKELNRPIIYRDITKSNIGFSSIVINRIWGNLTNCKKELGLMPSVISKPIPFREYKEKLDMALDEISLQTSRKIISWNDIENCSLKIEHKSMTKAFNREDMNIFEYIKSKGFMMNPSKFSFHYTFDDGERVVSSLEYIFSLYLKENGYVYNRDYQRDVMYKEMMTMEYKSRMNCDYVFGRKCIEIAGMIDYANGDWDVYKYNTKQQITYQNKMIQKRDLLEANHIDYLFLFPEDFYTYDYKKKFLLFMNQKEVLYA